MFIPQFRVHPAPGQDGVGGADHCRLMKDKPDVFFIILFQKRTVNDAENVLPMSIPVVCHRPVDDFFNQVWEVSGIIHFKTFCQCEGNCQFMFFPELE
ncbi:MAG: hypothetical protein J6J12_08965 [Oscillospiraceae bacterium]|nr:hypothetical protein [Oscillospiraceae bacterium]